MSTVPITITVDGDTYTVPTTDTVEPLAASVTYDGSGAGGNFVPCLSFFSQSGQLLSRTFPSATVTAGDTVEVSFIPFVPPASGGEGGGGIQFDVENTGDWLHVTATDPAPPTGESIEFTAAGAILLQAVGLVEMIGVDVVTLFSSLTFQGGSDVNFTGTEMNMGGTPASPNPFNYLFLNGGALSFFGVNPVPQQATPVTLGDVIALLQAYGLSA